MKDISLVLDNNDIKYISNLLKKDGGNPQLTVAFSLVRMQKCPFTLWSNETDDQETIHTMSELIDDLDLDLELNDDIEPQPSPGLNEEPYGYGYSVPAYDCEVTIPEPIPEPPAPEPEVHNRVVAGWDDRVPRPVPDPDLMVQKQTSQPVTSSGFHPVPNADVIDRTPKVNMGHPGIRPAGTPMRPAPEPVPEPVPEPIPEPIPAQPAPQPKRAQEPDIENDGVCQICGGFLPINPHSDPAMNCNCIHPLPPPQPARPAAAWSTGVAPNTGQSWSTS